MTSRQDDSASPSGGGEEPLVVTPVEPCGTRKQFNMFGDEHEVPVYPFDSGRIRLRGAAHEVAAAILGITWEQWRDLMGGEATCDWAEAERRLRAYVAARKEKP